MAELKEMFDEAVANSKNLTKKPSNDVLLKIYSLYKQATSGDVSGKRPGRFSMVDRAKFDAWSGLKGTEKSSAMQSYVDLINGLRADEKKGSGFG